jgi:transcriptional accessory protein Tex/SPT6
MSGKLGKLPGRDRVSPGRRPAECVRRASGILSGGAQDSCRDQSDIKALIGNTEILRQVRPRNFVDDTFGLPTVTDIQRELEKPDRDSRPAFKAAVFKEGVETVKDLKRGMFLEGTVTTVAAFGAFVDIGVHQDGLVHISCDVHASTVAH